MTGQAVIRCFTLGVALDAKTHRVIHHAPSHSHFSHVAMTSRALNVRADVRGMIESDVRFFIPTVYSLPRRLLAFFEVSGELLNRRFIRIDLVMTAHAHRHTRKVRDRAGPYASVAVLACQTRRLDVRLVRVSDGLSRFGMDAEKVLHGLGYR